MRRGTEVIRGQGGEKDSWRRGNRAQSKRIRPESYLTWFERSWQLDCQVETCHERINRVTRGLACELGLQVCEDLDRQRGKDPGE